MIIYHNKEIGQTMNQVIDDIKKLYHTKKITYAGRLDPLAYGLVIILTDDDIYKRDNYIGQNKVYQFQMINGIQTDTYDILGLIKNINVHLEKDPIIIKKILDTSSDKGIISIEKMLAMPAWYPIKSLESVNGEEWIIQKKLFIEFIHWRHMN